MPERRADENADQKAARRPAQQVANEDRSMYSQQGGRSTRVIRLHRNPGELEHPHHEPADDAADNAYDLAAGKHA